MHFTTAVKAWSYECTHPFRDEWFANLDQTPYRGWRPSRGAYLAGRGAQARPRVKDGCGRGRARQVTRARPAARHQLPTTEERARLQLWGSQRFVMH